jgi:hypothetical protein
MTKSREVWFEEVEIGGFLYINGLKYRKTSDTRCRVCRKLASGELIVSKKRIVTILVSEV